MCPHFGAVICPDRANESPCVPTYIQSEGGTPLERSNAAARGRTFEQKPLVRETSGADARKIGRISPGKRLQLR